VSDALNKPFTFVDTELSAGIQRHSLVGLLRGAMSRKRRADGEPLTNLVCALLVWPLLKVPSLERSTGQPGAGGASVGGAVLRTNCEPNSVRDEVAT
jgi:hypothetical protein